MPCAAVLAKAVQNRPSGGAQGISHLLIHGLHLFIGVNVAGAAPVILQIIDAPLRVRAGILLLVAVTSFVTGASIWSGRRVNADLETLAVHIGGTSLHIVKLLVGLNVALQITL